MSISVRDLLEGKAPPLTIERDQSVKDALSLLITHDYSQLPVIDDAGKPIALVTSRTVMRALSHFGVTVDSLRVLDVMDERITQVDPGDDLFDILDHLQRLPAVLVVDATGKLTGILTTYDATEHLLQRVQDILLVQDIEEMIKEYIQDAFRTHGDELDTDRLNEAVAEITPSNRHLNKPFRLALQAYLTEKGIADTFDEKVAQHAFQEHFQKPQKPATFDRLTLGDHIRLLLHKHCWSKYEPLFSIEQRALRRLLDAVRDTRNDLAHLRSDISDAQRDQLQYCKDWLSRHQGTERFDEDGDSSKLEPTEAEEVRSVGQVSAEADVLVTDIDELMLPEEGRDAKESRYFPLLRELRRTSMERDRIRLSFAQVETIINSKLPPSARAHRSWWANNRHQPQARNWLDAGWRVGRVNMTDEHVTFVRNKERELVYIEFFNGLLQVLQERGQWAHPLPSPMGQSWLRLAQLSQNGRSVAVLTCAFTHRKRFAIALYIDTGDKKENKAIFDMLLGHRGEIETQLGESLHWDRLDHKQAARVSLFYEKPVTVEQANEFEALRLWIVSHLKRFHDVMARHIDASFSAVERQPSPLHD